MFLSHNKPKAKKAEVSVQINWIFVLIVGGIILIFFISIVMKQKTVSSVKSNIAVREALDTILVSAQVATGTASVVNVPEINVEFDCHNYFVGDFDTGINKQLGQSRVLYVPSKLQGRKLLTWSLEWNLPFKIQDFLYVTSSEMRYVFVYSGNGEDFAREIFNILPQQMNKEIYSYDGVFKDATGNPVSVVYKNNYKTKFVFFGVDEEVVLDSSFKGKDVSAIKIVQDSNKEIGGITFYKYESHNHLLNLYPWTLTGDSIDLNTITTEAEKSTLPYFDFNPEFTTKKFYPSLFGAIFTDSFDLYGCMYKKAFTRYSYITSVYLSRIDKMLEDKSQQMIDRGCIDSLYGKKSSGNVGGYLAIESLDETAKSCSADLQDVGCGLSDVDGLINANKVIQEDSCPLIY